MQKDSSEYQTVEHLFEPVYNRKSRILILGSLPSVKSRENHFYYGHPQNRFWKLIATLCWQYDQQEKSGLQETESMVTAIVPQTIEEKKKLLYDHHIAIWDVIAQCDIIGSSDSSIKNVVPNDMQKILDQAPIERIYANGGKAYELYMQYCYPVCKRKITKLPSTSPANAAFSMDKLLSAWSVVIQER
ncbi:MAG: DNA-deoxyinosine glycosylase [Lachnospiraceae bacterium]|nr:DNA-deoxyinosine glycosylase [Lachnospiraceae bacterium]